MEPLKIALLQIAPGDSLNENLKKGVGACRKAREMGADIALFPEMFSNPTGTVSGQRETHPSSECLPAEAAAFVPASRAPVFLRD